MKFILQHIELQSWDEVQDRKARKILNSAIPSTQSQKPQVSFSQKLLKLSLFGVQTSFVPKLRAKEKHLMQRYKETASTVEPLGEKMSFWAFFRAGYFRSLIIFWGFKLG